MALDKNILLDELVKFCVPVDEKSSNLPTSLSDASNKWADALGKYCETIFPASVTISQAKDSFKALFLTLNPASGNGLVVFPQCIQAFQSTLGAGMIGYVSVPPTNLIDMNPVKAIGMAGGTTVQALSSFCDIVDQNFRTGTATDSVPTTYNWS